MAAAAWRAGCQRQRRQRRLLSRSGTSTCLCPPGCCSPCRAHCTALSLGARPNSLCTPVPACLYCPCLPACQVGNYPGRALSFSGAPGGGAALLSLPSKALALYAPPGGTLIARSDTNGEDLEAFAGAGLYDRWAVAISTDKAAWSMLLRGLALPCLSLMAPLTAPHAAAALRCTTRAACR